MAPRATTVENSTKAAQSRRGTQLKQKRAETQRKYLERRPVLIKRIKPLREQAKKIKEQEQLKKDFEEYSKKLKKGQIKNINEIPTNVRPYFKIEDYQKEVESKIKPEIEENQKKLSAIEKDYNSRVERLRDWKSNALKGATGEERSQIREDYEEELLDLREDFKPQIEYYKEKSKRLNEQLSNVQKGDLLSAEGIKSYAEAYADYERKKEEIEYKNKKIQEKNKKLQETQEQFESQREQRILDLAKYETETGIRLDIDPSTLKVKGVKSIQEKGKVITPKQFETIYGISPEQAIGLEKKPEVTMETMAAQEVSPVTAQAKQEKTFIQKVLGSFTGGIGTVSAKGLNMSEVSQRDGLSSSDRDISRLDSGTPTLSSSEMGTSDSFINRLFSSFKKSEKETIKKDEEKFGSITGGVVSAYDKKDYEGAIAEPPKQTLRDVGRDVKERVSEFQTPSTVEELSFQRIDRGEKVLPSKQEVIDLGIEKVDKFLSKPLTVTTTKEQYGTIQDMGLESENPFFKPVEIETTRGEQIGNFLEPLAIPSKGVREVLDYSAKGWEDIFKQQRKLQNLGKRLPESGFKNKFLRGVTQANQPSWAIDVQEKIITGYVRSGNLVLYAVPFIGEALMVSDIAESGDRYINADKSAENIAKKGYKEYVQEQKPNLKEGEKLLSEREYVELVKPDIVKGIKSSALVNVALGTTILAGDIVVRGARAIRDYKRFRYETKNYNEAKKVFDKQKELSKFADIKESVGSEIGVIRQDFKKFGLDDIGINKKYLDNAQSIEVSLSTQEVSQLVPKLSKIKVPKGGKLAEKTENIYTVYNVEKVSYRNTLNFVVRLKDGTTRVFSKSFITNKPIQRFRNIQNAIKYARGKKLTLSELKPDEEMIRSGVYKIRGNKLKAEGKFLTSVKKIKEPEGLFKSDFVSEGETFAGITRRRGKVESLGAMPDDELFSLSPTESRAIVKQRVTKGKDFIDLDAGVTAKQRKKVSQFLTDSKADLADFSTVKRNIKELEKRKPTPKRKKLDTDFVDIDTPKVKRTPTEGRPARQEQVLREDIPMAVKEDVAKTITKRTSATAKRVPRRPRFKTDIPLSTEIALGVGRLTTGLSKKKVEEATELRSGKRKKEVQDTGVESIQDLLKEQDVAQDKAKRQRQVNEPLLNTELIPVTTGFGTTSIPSRRPKRRPRKPRIRFDFRLRQRQQREVISDKDRGYNVFIKERGRFIKASPVPIKKSEAKNLRDFAIDNVLSRQGYIKPTNQRAKPSPYNIPKGYSKRVNKKFRTFRQKKGKKTPLPIDRVIEKSDYALDKRSEVSQLNTARFLSKYKKKKKSKPVGLSFA